MTNEEIVGLANKTAKVLGFGPYGFTQRIIREAIGEALATAPKVSLAKCEEVEAILAEYGLGRSYFHHSVAAKIVNTIIPYMPLKPKPLQWTREKPKVDGLYLLKQPDGTILARNVRSLETYAGNVRMGSLYSPSNTYKDYLWAGPIAEPLPASELVSVKASPVTYEEWLCPNTSCSKYNSQEISLGNSKCDGCGLEVKLC